ncbi:MAG: zinc ribbon domain-containing protein [Ruminococcus sp.]|nr:zinc ribbon domain-containing protein [Ruminococcus sp.]
MPERICHKCGNKLIDGAKFCKNCGASAAEVKPAAKKFCVSCGAALPEGAEHCPRCGTRAGTLPKAAQAAVPVPQPAAPKAVNAPAETKAKRIPKKKNSTFSKVLAAVLAVVLCIEAAVICFVRPGWLRSKTAEDESNSASGGEAPVSGTVDLSSGGVEGFGENIGSETAYVETPVVSTETLTVPEDGSAVAAKCGAVIEMGAHNACFAEELTVVQHEPDTESLTDGTRTCYEITAGDVHEFDFHFDITLPYDPSGTDPADEASSVFAEYFNEDTQQWELIPCDVDTENDRVVIHTDHLSRFTPVTVRNSSKLYARLSKYENILVSDEAALAELSAKIDNNYETYQEDPFVMAYFYYTIYNTTVLPEVEKGASYFDADTLNKVKSALPKVETVNTALNWLASISADALSYKDIIPNTVGNLRVGSSTYAPGDIVGSFASLTDYMAGAAILEQIKDEIDSGEYHDADGFNTASKGTIAELYKWTISHGTSALLSELGAGFSSLYAVPAVLVDMLLEKVKSSYQEALNNAQANILFGYYEERAGRPYLSKNEERIKSDITGEVFKDEDGNDKVRRQSWETLLLKAERINAEKYGGDPAQLAAMIDSRLNADVKQAFDVLVRDADEINFAVGAGMSEKDKTETRLSFVNLDEKNREAVCDKVKLMIRKKLESEGVYEQVAKQMRADLREESLKWGSEMRGMLTFKHSFIIEEIIPSGKESTYAGCNVEFISTGITLGGSGALETTDELPGIKNTETVVWKGQLDAKGGLAFNFNTAAYLKSGAPSKLVVYKKGSSEVLIEKYFTVSQQSTKISLGQQESQGHWEKVSETAYGSDHFVQIQNEVTDIKVTIGRYEYNLTNNSVSNKEVATASPTPPEILVPGDEMTVTFTYHEESNRPQGSKIWFEVNFLPDASLVASDGRYSGSDAVSLVKIAPEGKTKDLSQTETFVIPDNSNCKNGQMALQYIIYSGKNVFVYKWVDGVAD